MAQSRIYLKCKECGKKFYLARLSSAIIEEYIGVYDRITNKDLQQFFDEHGHLSVNGKQFELSYQ